MAATDYFPAGALTDVLADFADWIGTSGLPRDGTSVSTAPIAIWHIGHESAPIRGHAWSTNRWHHQVMHKGRAIAFARSRVTRPPIASLPTNHAELEELGESPLVDDIDAALRALRVFYSVNGTIRLLCSEHHYGAYLWLCWADGTDGIVPLSGAATRPIWLAHADDSDPRAAWIAVAVAAEAGARAIAALDVASVEVPWTRVSTAIANDVHAKLTDHNRRYGTTHGPAHNFASSSAMYRVGGLPLAEWRRVYLLCDTARTELQKRAAVLARQTAMETYLSDARAGLAHASRYF